MNLDKIQNLEIKRFLLSIEILRLSMWLNVLYEFDGPLTIWRKALSDVTDDIKIENFETKEVLKYLRHYIYTDFSHYKLYPHKPLFLTQTFLIISELNIDKLLKYFPVEYHVKCIERTGKYDYRHERLHYKHCHRIASEGADIKDHFYEQYKCIAMKYNWPFIVNSDDTEY